MWFTLHGWAVTGGGHALQDLKPAGIPNKTVSKPHFDRKNKQEVTQEMLLTQLHQVLFHATQQNYQCPHVRTIYSVQVQ